MIELRQLEYFLAICEELHFTRAAENLNISQPSLSQQIKNLEFAAGTPLFDRIGKSVALTEAGKILKKHSDRIFFEMEQAHAAIRDLNGLERGKLSVGSLLTCVHYLLPPAIFKFREHYPNIELSIQGMRTGKIIKSLQENELDIGITFLPIEEENMESMPLFTEELALAVPSDHPFAMLQQVELKEAANVPTILLPNTYFQRQMMIDSYFKDLGISLQPTLEMSTLESLVKMVAEGMGVTILPEPYLDNLENDKIEKVKLLNPTPERQIGFVYRKDKFMCTATRTFMEQIIRTSESISYPETRSIR